MVSTTGRQQSNGATYPPLADIQGQRSMRGLRMNTLGWFDLNQRGLRRRIQSSLRLLAVMTHFLYSDGMIKYITFIFSLFMHRLISVANKIKEGAFQPLFIF